MMEHDPQIRVYIEELLLFFRIGASNLNCNDAPNQSSEIDHSVSSEIDVPISSEMSSMSEDLSDSSESDQKGA